MCSTSSNGQAEARNGTAAGVDSGGEKLDWDAIRLRAVGNARFLAELGLAQVLPHSILYKCVRHLLQLKCGGFQFSTNMECLCQLLTICGGALDSAKGVALMDQFFGRILRILEQPGTALPNRLRFMLEDVVALRNNRWVPKHRGQRARVEEPQKRDNRALFGGREESAASGAKVVPLHLLHMDSDSSSLFRRDSDSAGLSFGGGRQAAGRGGSVRGPPAPTFDVLSASGAANNANRNRAGQGETNGLFCSLGTVPVGGRRRNGEAAGGRKKGGESGPAQAPPQLMSANISLDFGLAAPGGANSSSSGNWRGAGEAASDGVPPNLPPRLLRKVQHERRWETNPTGSGPVTTRQGLPSPSDAARRPNGPGLAPGISLYPGGSRQAASLSTASRAGRGNLPPNLFEPAYLQRPGTGLAAMLPASGRPATGGKGQGTGGASRKASGGEKKEAGGEGDKAKLDEALDECWATEELDVEACRAVIQRWRLLPRCGAQLVDAWIRRLLLRLDSPRLPGHLGLLTGLLDDGQLAREHVARGLANLCARLGELESAAGGLSVGLKSKLARVLAAMLVMELVSLQELCRVLDGGLHHPLFLLTLQQAGKGRALTEESGEDEEAPVWLLSLVEKSEVQLERMLPPSSRQQSEHVWEVFEERGLSFLLPRVKVMRQLRSWLPVVEDAEEAASDQLQTWLDANFPPRLFHSTPLVRAFYAAVTERVWNLGQQHGATGRDLLMLEKAWWRQVSEALKRQVTGGEVTMTLQVEAVHALQLVWHEIGQPKDFLLRCFMNLYDLEVLEEDAFLAWREEVNPAYPDKGRALFQVNQWLTWLEEAEEEDSADDDD